MSYLKLKYRQTSNYQGGYLVRIFRSATPNVLERETPIPGPLPEIVMMSILTNLKEDYIYEVYATACGTGTTLVAKGVAKASETCQPPTVNTVEWDGSKLTFYFSNLPAPPKKGYRILYRIKDSSGPMLEAPGRYEVSPAIVAGLFPGHTYQWVMQGDCGNGVYSLEIVGEINT